MKEKTTWQQRRERFRQASHSRGVTLAVYLVLRVLVIFCMIRQFIQGNYNYVMLCVLSLVIMVVPSFLRGRFRIYLPDALEVSIYIFVFAAEILGEIGNFYGYIPFWDTLLHTFNGFLAASIGFNLVELLNTRTKRMNMTPLFVAIVSFCFSMTVGVLWEFVEFSADGLLYLDMQKDEIVTTVGSVSLNPEMKNEPVIVRDIAYTVLYDADGNELAVVEGGYLDIGIVDTMEDLFVNLVGALTFSILGWFYLRRKQGKESIVDYFIITMEPKKERVDALIGEPMEPDAPPDETP